MALCMVEEKEFTETQHRLYSKLHSDLGYQIIRFLSEKTVTEIMLNSDGRLWVDSIASGQKEVGCLSSEQAFSILRSVAGINHFIIDHQNPCLEAQLPIYKELNGQRFTGQIPPIVASPTFTIRKRSEVIFSLDDYVNCHRMTGRQKNTLESLVKDRKNILVCGGPGSGKTTVTNALIQAAVKSAPYQRFFCLEDTPELQCSAINKTEMLTTRHVSMTNLIKTCMRMRPDRILIGEVRGAEALDMLKAWNTGCPGGISTVHANGACEAIQRILDLSMEAGLPKPPIPLVAHTIDAIVTVIAKEHQKGFIHEIFLLEGFKDEQFQFKKVG